MGTKPTDRITISLDPQQAWFLHCLLDECLEGIYQKEIFKTNDDSEGDDELTGMGSMSYDQDFYDHIEEVREVLGDARLRDEEKQSW